MSPVLQAISWGLIGLALLLSLRLALTAWRERSLPEALMALFFFGGGGGYAALVLPTTLDPGADALAVGRQVASWAFLLPHITVAIFTRRVFRPDAPWALVLASTLAIASVSIQLATQFLDFPYAANAAQGASTTGMLLFWTNAALRATSFGWACGESAHYYAMSRRRLALGIGEPVVANRFLLWAVWSGAAATSHVLRVTLAAVDPDRSVAGDEPLGLVVGLMVAGLVCSVAVWLTFAAPGFYRRWVAGAAPAAR